MIASNKLGPDAPRPRPEQEGASGVLDLEPYKGFIITARGRRTAGRRGILARYWYSTIPPGRELRETKRVRVLLYARLQRTAYVWREPDPLCGYVYCCHCSPRINPNSGGVTYHYATLVTALWKARKHVGFRTIETSRQIRRKFRT